MQLQAAWNTYTENSIKLFSANGPISKILKRSYSYPILKHYIQKYYRWSTEDIWNYKYRPMPLCNLFECYNIAPATITLTESKESINHKGLFVLKGHTINTYTEKNPKHTFCTDNKEPTWGLKDRECCI